MYSIEKVTVFCASSKKVPVKYLNVASELGVMLAREGIEVVYGGGAIGLMGELANSVLSGQGKITGIIPEFMMEVEWGHPQIKSMIVVNDMHERKKRLIDNADAVVVLPGGTGTLEETLEVITLKRLGKFLKSIIFVNTDGFYNDLLNFFDKMVKEKFLGDNHIKIWSVIDHLGELMDAIKNAPPWDASAINNASVN